MELAVLEAVLGDAELIGVAADVGERDPRRLLHHVAELPGEHEALLARHRGRLDEEHVAAGARHRQAGRHARDRRALDRLLEEALAPERLAHGLDVDRHRRLHFAAGEARGRLSQQLAELALEVADARLARVLGDDRAHDVVG